MYSEKQSLIIDQKRLAHFISPHLFGHNLEHTRAAVYGGLSAQLLRNRKFCSHPAPDGVAQDWYRIGGDAAYFYFDSKDTYTIHTDPKAMTVRGRRPSNATHLDNPTAPLIDPGTQVRYSELNSQKIQNPDSQTRVGIGQSGIALQKGQDYQFRTALTSMQQCAVQVSLYSSVELLFSKELLVETGGWQTFSFCFCSPVADCDARLEITIDGVGEFGIGVASLLPQNHFYEMRRDVIERLREMGVTMLRWPGGNFAGEYRWKDGLLEVDRRGPLASCQPTETQTYLSFDNHEIGINQFILLCRELNAEPYITLNLYWDSEETCREWLEYCNGTADTPWGAVRAKAGFERPFGVRYWALGNEHGWGHMEGLNDPLEYLEKAYSTAIILKKQDPSILLCSCGPCPDLEWVEATLPRLSEVVELVNFHVYNPFNFHRDVDFIHPDGYEKALAICLGGASLTAAALTQLRETLDRNRRTQEIQISFDEWNLHSAWLRKPSAVEGIFVAAMLMLLCNCQQNLKLPLSCYFQPVNEGCIEVGPFASKLTPMGQAFAFLRPHSGACVIETDTPDGIEGLSTWNEGTGEIIFSCFNRGAVSLKVQVELVGFKSRFCCSQILFAKKMLPSVGFEEREWHMEDGELTVPPMAIVRLVYSGITIEED